MLLTFPDPDLRFGPNPALSFMALERKLILTSLAENMLRRGSAHDDRRLVILFSPRVSASWNAYQCRCVSGEDRDAYTFSHLDSGVVLRRLHMEIDL
jgi:hypothetical protein